MKAIILNEFGDTDKLIYTDLNEPQIAADEVLIKTAAISINPVDIKTRSGKALAGKLKDLLPVILGWDISGTVVAIGDDVTEFKTGDEVFGMVNFPGHGKAYAEFVAAPAAHLALKPSGITHEQAAATTLAALTAYQAIVQKAALKKGETIIIHAASGGVGHYAVQIAKHVGAHVTGTSSERNREFVLELGADEHIDYTKVSKNEWNVQADFVLDCVGGENLLLAATTVKPGGRFISIPSSIPPEVQEKMKQQNIHAEFFMVQSNGDDMKVLADWLANGIIKPYINQFDFMQMAGAHAQQASGRTRGKIVLSI
ncbi:MAG: NADP-dependent oxidoreductase [Flavitalea sp.]